MSNPWFRMYAELAHDPKVQMLSEAMQRRYMMLMCMRCSNALVTLHETEIAFHLRISNEELAETKALFIAKQFIDDQWNLLNWEKRQFASDSSAMRVARHRASKKEAGNGNVTLQEQPCNALDTDTDTDTYKDIPAPQTKILKPTAKKKTALPADFKISLRVQEWAQEKGYTQLDAHYDRFVGACRAKGYSYVDWDEGFMGAIRDNWAKVPTPITQKTRALVL